MIAMRKIGKISGQKNGKKRNFVASNKKWEETNYTIIPTILLNLSSFFSSL
jgi:hypothetical protein